MRVGREQAAADRRCHGRQLRAHGHHAQRLQLDGGRRRVRRRDGADCIVGAVDRNAESATARSPRSCAADRLLSSRAADGYSAIVYKKGALVLDLLARVVGDKVFPQALGKAAAT